MVTRTAQELQGDTARAIQILELFTDSSKRDVQLLIPQSVLANAHGLVFIRMYRGGFMVSAKKGTGIIIARLPDGSWSAPSGISMGALGFGHQAGVEVIDSIIVMNYRAAVKSFFDGGGQLQLGANVSVSAGPLGRAANVSAAASSGQHISATYAYSASKGLFAGYSFEGSKISERVNTNAAFYGRSISAREILTGGVPRPPQAQRLYDILASLGAGPRPGMPFAPKKGPPLPVPPPPQQQQHSFYNNQHQQQQQQQHIPPSSPYHQPHSPYSQHYNNIPGGAAGTNDAWRRSSYQKPPEGQQQQQQYKQEPGFDEPPPPYEPSNNPSMYASTANGDAKQGASTTFPPSSSSSGGHQQPAVATTADASNSSNSNNNAAAAAAAAAAAPGYTASPGYEHFYANDTKKNPSGFDQQQQQGGGSTVVVAKYNFGGEQPGDLTFSEGDYIIVTQRKGDRQAWWEGEIGDRKGMFPANYTEDLS